jgi:uncharacterized protein
VIVYVESSAVLSWLLGEPDGVTVRDVFRSAEFVLTSELTFVECDRALHRAETLGRLTSDGRAELADRLRRTAEAWTRLMMGSEVLARARGSFPEEPIRSLDALHLASALVAQSQVPDLVVLSLDERIRRVGKALGFRLAPPSE